MTPEREAIDIRKNINISASPEEVFQLWSNLENYPRFMEHVRDVRKTGVGQYHWVVDGPGGAPVEWTTEITEYEPNDKIAWRSISGTRVAQTGFTRFIRNEDGTTRLDVHMSYMPPG